MFLTRYQDLALLDAGHAAPHPNLLLHARSGAVRLEARTTSLAVFTALRGLELHEVGPARFAVVPGRYLLLNEGTRHAQALEDRSEVLSVRFRQGFGGEVHTAFAAPHAQQLENPAYRLAPPAFFERTYPHDARLAQLLGLLRAFIWTGVGQDALEQALQPVLERLLVMHRALEPEIERLSAAKRSTREELYRRLHVARDFIEASFSEGLDLAGIAGVVHLSPHHFLRLFKEVFGVTPYQMVRGRRLEQAKKQLEAGHLSVTDVCFELGFESLGSFSRDFKRHFGLSPSQVRGQPG